MNMNSILKTLDSVLGKTKTPLAPLPPQLLFIGANTRSGLSAEEIASEIIAKQVEAGAPFGNVFSDSDNINEKMELIRCTTMIEYILNNAKIEVVVPAGIPVITYGANSAGVVVGQGTTTMIIPAYGVIR